MSDDNPPMEFRQGECSDCGERQKVLVVNPPREKAYCEDCIGLRFPGIADGDDYQQAAENDEDGGWFN